MPKVRVNYEGWIALPASVRQRFGISTGDQLELEVIDGRISLRPLNASGAAGPVPAASITPEPASPVVAPPEAARRPGRPRKAPVAALPPTLKTRGRRPSMKV